VTGAIVQCAGYALMFWKPPYPLYATAFFLTSMGIAYQDAQSNSFTTGVQNAHRWLGVLHAVYGVGAVVSPLVANTIAARTRYWHYYYLVTLGLAAINVCLLAWTFREKLFKPNVLNAKDTAGKELKATLTSRTVWILNAFFFLYVGAEVTAGGTYLYHHHHLYLPAIPPLELELTLQVQAGSSSSSSPSGAAIRAG